MAAHASIDPLIGAAGPSLHLARSSSGVVWVTLDSRPVNSIDSELASRLFKVFEAAHADLSVRALVIHGANGHFCAGADLKEKANKGPGDGVSFWEMIAALDGLRCPTVAAIDGACAGGGLDLALSCDVRIAATGSRFICAGVSVGLSASAAKLTRLIGLSQAKRLLLTGLPFDAEEAFRIGLTAVTTSPDTLVKEAERVAERIASRAPLAAETTKRLANGAAGLTMDEASRLQATETRKLRETADHKEGISAILEKRDPVFKRA